MDVVQVIQELGFPIAAAVGLGMFGNLSIELLMVWKLN
jgi:hypothetical protein